MLFFKLHFAGCFRAFLLVPPTWPELRPQINPQTVKVWANEGGEKEDHPRTCKWLLLIVSKSPKDRVVPLSNGRTPWLINGSDPSYLLGLMVPNPIPPGSLGIGNQSSTTLSLESTHSGKVYWRYRHPKSLTRTVFSCCCWSPCFNESCDEFISFDHHINTGIN